MAKTRQISSQGYQVTVLDFNGDEGKTPDGVVLFLHGLGAEANQFRDFATHIMRASKLGSKHVRFVLPQALKLEGMDQVGWFGLNLMSWQMAFMGGEQALAAKIRETPEHMHTTREKLLNLLKEQGNGVPVSKWAIGGFSMGASMTVEVAALLKENPAGLLVCSALPLNVNEWAAGLNGVKGTKVLHLHGRSDPLIPIMASNWVRDMLKHCGLDVNYVAHNGGHDIGGMAEMDAIQKFFQDALA
jgi:predicted esterase|eukprot:g6831.t1